MTPDELRQTATDARTALFALERHADALSTEEQAVLARSRRVAERVAQT